MKLIEVMITAAMRDVARARADKQGELRNSILRGEGNFVGFLGELIAQLIIGGTIDDKRDYDIKTPDGVTWDVKTKRCSGAPEEHYECSIANFNTTQKCDRYLFVRIKSDFSVGWICGWLPKNEYFRRAKFVEGGQRDAANNWLASCDCWNVPISLLEQLDVSDAK